MSTTTTVPSRLWVRWKSLKLPWRRQWLCGHDLAGNTFWEFKNQMNPARNRRIAKYPSNTHYGDIALTPAWLQWLRHTRPIAPTLEEQQYEVQRQDNIKQLAARADERWREQESFLDSPKEYGQTKPLMEPRDKGGYVPQTEQDSHQGVRNMAADPREVAGKIRGEDVDKGRFKGETKEEPRDGKPSPWEQYKQQKGPSEGWQPDAWKPGKVERR